MSESDGCHPSTCVVSIFLLFLFLFISFNIELIKGSSIVYEIEFQKDWKIKINKKLIFIQNKYNRKNKS